jgi:hypothetical protein
MWVLDPTPERDPALAIYGRFLGPLTEKISSRTKRFPLHSQRLWEKLRRSQASAGTVSVYLPPPCR